MKACFKSHLLGILPLFLLIGCANELTRVPTAAVRARIGRVAVQAAPSITQTSFVKPYTRGQAAAAAAWEMLEGREVGVLLMPVGATVGAMYGTPTEEIEAGSTVLANACAGVDFQKTVRRDVVAAIGKYTRHPVVPAGRSRTHPSANSTLELNVLQAGLAGKRYKNSKLKVFLLVQAHLKSLPDGTELYQNAWYQIGSEQTFNEWSEQGGRALRQELAFTSREVAARIVREIFLAETPAKGDWFSPSPSSPDGWRDDGTSSIDHSDWKSAW